MNLPSVLELTDFVIHFIIYDFISERIYDGRKLRCLSKWFEAEMLTLGYFVVCAEVCVLSFMIS